MCWPIPTLYSQDRLGWVDSNGDQYGDETLPHNTSKFARLLFLAPFCGVWDKKEAMHPATPAETSEYPPAMRKRRKL